MPTKTGYYSDDVLDKRFPQKDVGKQVAREQSPSKPYPDNDQDKLEYSPAG